MRPGAASVDPVLQNPSDGNPFLEGRESRTPEERLTLRRSDSQPNQPGWLVRVVANQYPAVNSDVPPTQVAAGDLIGQLPVGGLHEVVIESPAPHRRLTELSAAETARVLLAWQRRVRVVERLPTIESVTVFRNEGFSAGASLPHVHSQILAVNSVPPQMQQRLQRMEQYRRQHGSSLLLDLLRTELSDELRIVTAGSGSVVLCPWAGRVAWQVRVAPAPSVMAPFADCPESVLIDVASHLHAAAVAVDACAGPLAMNVLLVQPPPDCPDQSWYLDLMPRCARMAGYELATDVDIVTVSPESSAELLRPVLAVVEPAADEVIPPEYAWCEAASLR